MLQLNLQFFGGRGSAGSRNSSGGGSATAEEKFEYQRNPELKEWSKAEESRTEQKTHEIFEKLDKGSWQEYYEENTVEKVDTFRVSGEGWRSDDEVEVYKMNLTYAQNYDENDRRVKMGKVVTGSTYYVAYDGNGSIDETHWAYKTKADAIHAAQLHVDRTQQLNKYRARGRKNR